MNLLKINNFLIAFLSHFLFLQAVFAQPQKTVIGCTTAGYEPFEVKNAKGEWVGFDIHMISEFEKFSNIKVIITDMKWDGIFPALFSKKCDFIMSGMSITEERAKVVNFSHQIYTDGNVIVVAKKNEALYPNLKAFDQKDVKIAVKMGNTADLVLSNKLKNAQILKFGSNADIVTAVLEGRAHAFAQSFIFSRNVVLEHPNKLVMGKEKINEEQLAVAFRKKDTELLKEFNAFLDQWKSSADYKKSVDYYLESRDWKEKLG